MTVIRQKNHLTGDWDVILVGKQGTKGDKGDKGDNGSAGVYIGTTPPSDHSLLWGDTNP